jgi:cardiolipin synthase
VNLTFEQLWPWIVGIGGGVIAVVAAAHAILNKRDVRAAIGWAGLIIVNPFLGAVAYYVFGINRIARLATRLGPTRSAEQPALPSSEPPRGEEMIAELPEPMLTLSRTIGRISQKPLLEGNAVTPLFQGDRAYPEMLSTIESAERSVVIATYIFDNDAAGRLFLEALARAVERGVEVRVLIDGVGRRYSRPPMTRLLRRRGVPVAEFLPVRRPWRSVYMNLRSHRKLVVVDRRVGFVGGMNIREGCLLERRPRWPVQDTHFRMEGPIVDQMFATFADDWSFNTGERLDGEPWASRTAPAGTVLARGIPDGPDEDFETLHWTLSAALGTARDDVRIVTPYFIPDQRLIAALRLAALRGVTVDILLPARSNLRVVEWAGMAQLWQVLEPGCRVWLTPPPFDHSKLFVVDGCWSLVGSANWDTRSLRLNFEYDVECYDAELARTLDAHCQAKIREARQLTLEDVDRRPLALKLRDNLARLLSPYL